MDLPSVLFVIEVEAYSSRNSVLSHMGLSDFCLGRNGGPLRVVYPVRIIIG